MSHVQIEVHKGIADVTQLDPGIEVVLVDVDVKSVVRFSRKGEHIEWRILEDAEINGLAEATSHE